MHDIVFGHIGTASGRAGEQQKSSWTAKGVTFKLELRVEASPSRRIWQLSVFLYLLSKCSDPPDLYRPLKQSCPEHDCLISQLAK